MFFLLPWFRIWIWHGWVKQDRRCNPTDTRQYGMIWITWGGGWSHISSRSNDFGQRGPANSLMREIGRQLSNSDWRRSRIHGNSTVSWLRAPFPSYSPMKAGARSALIPRLVELVGDDAIGDVG